MFDYKLTEEEIKKILKESPIPELKSYCRYCGKPLLLYGPKMDEHGYSEKTGKKIYQLEGLYMCQSIRHIWDFPKAFGHEIKEVIFNSDSKKWEIG